jgi:hypothetical protein
LIGGDHLMQTKLRIIFVSAVLLSGCSLFPSQTTYTNTQNSQPNSQQTAKSGSKEATKPMDTSGTEYDETNPFTGSLKAAVALGIPLKCTYTVKGMEATGYIKGRQYYGEIKTEGEDGYVILQDTCMWTWNATTKEGMTMCMDEEDEANDIWDFDEAEIDSDYSCFPSLVSDSMFEPPNDIHFVNMDSLFESVGDMNEEAVQQQTENLRLYSIKWTHNNSRIGTSSINNLKPWH